jgi:hypothetical protein
VAVVVVVVRELHDWRSGWEMDRSVRAQKARLYGAGLIWPVRSCPVGRRSGGGGRGRGGVGWSRGAWNTGAFDSKRVVAPTTAEADRTGGFCGSEASRVPRRRRCIRSTLCVTCSISDVNILCQVVFLYLSQAANFPATLTSVQ